MHRDHRRAAGVDEIGEALGTESSNSRGELGANIGSRFGRAIHLHAQARFRIVGESEFLSMRPPQPEAGGERPRPGRNFPRRTRGTSCSTSTMRRSSASFAHGSDTQHEAHEVAQGLCRCCVLEDEPGAVALCAPFSCRTTADTRSIGNTATEFMISSRSCRRFGSSRYPVPQRQVAGERLLTFERVEAMPAKCASPS